MRRYGPLPGLDSTAGHRSLEPLPYELLENKMAVQAAEIERYARENQRLAAAHVALRQELVAAQRERQRLEAHIGSIQTENDIQIRVLLERIAKMDANIRAGESVKKDLQQAHMEAQSLLTARQELTSQIQQTTQELQKAHAEVKRVPEIHVELDNQRQEHRRLRAVFEYEKGLNIEQVEQMQAMETNLVSMAREMEKLRAEVSNAEKKLHAPNPYGYTYRDLDPSYSPAVQGSAVYIDGYGMPQVQMSVGAIEDEPLSNKQAQHTKEVECATIPFKWRNEVAKNTNSSKDIKVVSLIDRVRGSWDVDTLQTLFQPLDIIEICKIPISSLRVPDQLVWHFTKMGCFAVKSVSHLAKAVSDSQRASSSSISNAIDSSV
ncbi:hypothetical protein HHK36_025990 [Tetracentron sinense]|uniref:Uncharacterized protein n=1 Tax=Tetracentron sinense TaxID=13715 RepID=A0A835D644_TETSI|nr:hypothetical protein HHK36_025990 [Tetracentron sinense]